MGFKFDLCMIVEVWIFVVMLLLCPDSGFFLIMHPSFFVCVSQLGVNERESGLYSL